MTDKDIIELFFKRSESAIDETDKKYGAYCRTVSYNVLGSKEDTEECVNDTYMKLWNTIPPERPRKLATYIAAIARSIALNMRRRSSTVKRGGGAVAEVYEELADCVAAEDNVEEEADARELVKALNRFLAGLGREKQLIFMKRYYHLREVGDIAREMNISEEKVKTTLYRLRAKLRDFLIKEGYDV